MEQQFESKNNLIVFSQLFKIQLRYWFTNKMNLFLGLFISLYMMLCWVAFRQGNPFIMISGILAGVVRNAMQLYLRSMNDWRTRGMFDRAFRIPVSNGLKYVSILSFNLFMTTSIALIMFVITILAFPQQLSLLSQANHLMVWGGIIFMLVYLNWVSHFILTVIKNSRWCITVGTFVYFTTMYFLGLGFPFNLIISVDWLNYILYLHPFRYVMNIAQAGFVNAPNFYYEGNQLIGTIDFGYAKLSWLPYLLAALMILFFTVFCLAAYRIKRKSFKRNKSGRLVFNPSSNRYIQKLKQAQTLDVLHSLHNERKEYWKENKVQIIKSKKTKSKKRIKKSV